MTTPLPDTKVQSETPEQSKLHAKHADAMKKEIALLRGWLEYVERDAAGGGVIHAMLLTNISESCTKFVYHAGIINGDLLGKDAIRGNKDAGNDNSLGS